MDYSKNKRSYTNVVQTPNIIEQNSNTNNGGAKSSPSRPAVHAVINDTNDHQEGVNAHNYVLTSPNNVSLGEGQEERRFKTIWEDIKERDWANFATDAFLMSIQVPNAPKH